MAGTAVPGGRRDLRRVPRRAAGAVVRLLRLPAQAAARHDELTAQLRQAHADLTGAAARLEATTAVADEKLSSLRTEIDAMDARLRAAQTRTTTDAVERLDALLAAHAEALRRVASTTAAIAEHVATTDATLVRAGPLVSVILPVRDRTDVLQRAVASVRSQSYERWECIVVDDGSQEDVEKALAVFDDERVRSIRIAAAGAGSARNAGLLATTGELVAFLDSDNEWFPARLAHVVAAMQSAPWARWAVDGQLIDDTGGALPHVRDLRLPLSTLQRDNFIDLGSVVVRRDLLDTVGGFDPELVRLTDWDLIRRLAEVSPPLRLPTIGFRYHDDRDDRISVRSAAGPSAHRIRRRAIGSPASGLRVLLAEWHYPQLTETYIEADIAGLRSLGAEVEVWSQEDVAVPYEIVVPLHRGELADAIQAFGPDLVFSHWLHIGYIHRSTTRTAGIPHAVRAHGFDFDAGTVDELLRDPGVTVHLYPHHLGRWASHPRASAHPVGFDPERHRPRPDKDRHLVVRTTAGLPTKDLEVFWATAERCPEHRFVLVIGHVFQGEHRTEALLEAARGSGAPVEIRTDLDFDSTAALVGSAGIYLHTHGTSHPLGMPISIAEAMATGSYVLARDLPGMPTYVAGGGALYHGETVDERADHAAALITATARWDDERWQTMWRAAVDHAWTRFPVDVVAADLLAVWRDRLGVGPR